VGNLTLEAKQHSVKLDSLYEMLKRFTGPVPHKWTGALVEEFDRHHKTIGDTVAALRSFKKKAKEADR
jgi:uncharacterized protein YukE